MSSVLPGGYPFAGGLNTPFTPQSGTLTARTAANATEFAALDTNKDGTFNERDDPYSPYYPGNEFVDWVGSSIYYYGNVSFMAPRSCSSQCGHPKNLS